MQLVDGLQLVQLPVRNVDVARRFLSRALAADAVEHDRPGGQSEDVVLSIAGRQFGLHAEPTYARADGVLGVPTFAFEVTAAKLMAVVEVASAEGVDFDGPIRRRDVPYALESVYFNDHDGNHFHVYVPRTAHRKRAADWSGQIIRAGYVEIEAPDLDASVLFYEEVLGAELVGYSQDERKNLLQAHMRLPSSHVLTLSQVHEARWGPMLSQVLDGPSMAFSVPWSRWAGVSTHLDRLGVGESAPPEAGTNRRRRVAVDPAGNVFEYVAEWIE